MNGHGQTPNPKEAKTQKTKFINIFTRGCQLFLVPIYVTSTRIQPFFLDAESLAIKKVFQYWAKKVFFWWKHKNENEGFCEVFIA